MKLINLLPKPEQREVRLNFFAEQLLMFWIWVLVSMALVLALAFAAKIYLNNQSAQVDTEIATKSQELKSSDNEQVKQQIDSLNAQLINIKDISSQHYYWSAALIELSKLIPSDMHVSLLSFNRATGQVQLQGQSDTRDSVLKFWSNIHKSTFFKNINFPLANLDSATNDSYSFTFYVVPQALQQNTTIIQP